MQDSELQETRDPAQTSFYQQTLITSPRIDTMQMPRPNENHKKLEALVGKWRGKERV